MTREPTQRNPRQFDGHVHDKESSFDATIKPKRLVDAMKNNNVGFFFSTGHEVSPGFYNTKRYADRAGIGTYQSVEVPVWVEHKGKKYKVHLLLVDPTKKAETEIGTELEKMKGQRVVDALASLHLLGEKFPKIEYDEKYVRPMINGGSISKLRLAQMLFENRHNRDYFHSKRIFTPDQLREKHMLGDAPLTRYVFPAEKFISIARNSGAFVGLAHPGIERQYIVRKGSQVDNNKFLPNDVIELIGDMGVDFFERFHPRHSKEASRRIGEAALEADKPVTIGSDIHHAGQLYRLRFAPEEQNIVRKSLAEHAKKGSAFAQKLLADMKDFGAAKKKE